MSQNFHLCIIHQLSLNIHHLKFCDRVYAQGRNFYENNMGLETILMNAKNKGVLAVRSYLATCKVSLLAGLSSLTLTWSQTLVTGQGI